VKISLIFLITVLVVLGSSIRSASADDRRIEVSTNVTSVRIHFNGHKKPWVKTIKLAKPSMTVIKPCPNNFKYDCVYTVSKKGREKEIYSYKNDDLNWASYGTQTYVTSIVDY
jgi:hypothetical protein